MPKAESVARYLLLKAAREQEPSPVTQMQLQKLMYYAQGWNLAYWGEPLFEGFIEAWVHGPVVRELYPRFADYRSEPIAAHEAADDGSLTERDKALLDSIWSRYGRFAAWRLREMTHAEPPWRGARGGAPADAPMRGEITTGALRAFFESEHERVCREAGISRSDLNESRRSADQGGSLEFGAFVRSLDHGSTNPR